MKEETGEAEQLEEIRKNLKRNIDLMAKYFKRFKQFSFKFNKQTQLRQCLSERNRQLDVLEESFREELEKLKNI